MPSHLLIEATYHVTSLFVALAIATGTKALASVLRTWIEQASRTRRLVRSLQDAEPRQRPGIILACGQLEARSTGESGRDKADGALPAGDHHQPRRLILPDKGGDE